MINLSAQIVFINFFLDIIRFFLRFCILHCINSALLNWLFDDIVSMTPVGMCRLILSICLRLICWFKNNVLFFNYFATVVDCSLVDRNSFFVSVNYSITATKTYFIFYKRNFSPLASMTEIKYRVLSYLLNCL